MSLSTVKINMLSTNVSLSSLESNLNQLNNILIMADIKNINRVVNFISSTNGVITNTKGNIDKMYRLNLIELDVFFKEFNDKTNKMIKLIDICIINMKQLKSECVKIYTIYKYLDMATYKFNSNLINIDGMVKEYGRYINELINDIKNFKGEVDKHNNKLRVGDRS